MSSETPAAAPLSNAEVRKLKGQAQRLEASVRLGRGGVSPAFLAGLDRELTQHQLVKVRLYDLKDQRHEIGEQLARESGSHLVTVIGHVVVLYRPKPAAETSSDAATA
jgi:RNA-binding protein